MPYGQIFDPTGNVMDQSPAQQVRDDLSLTLRSVRDTLATSFNTLNLTMSSIHMTLRNMASAMPTANVQPHPNYIPAYGSMNLTGGLSQPMANHLANTSMMGLATGQRPYNTMGMEYGWQRQLELNHRYTQFGVDATTHLGGMALGYMGSRAMLGFAGSSMAPSFMGRMAMSGLGRLGLGVLGMGAAGIIGGPLLDGISDAAQVYGRDISGIRRMSTRFGNEFTNHQSAIAARGISNYGMREIMSTNDFDVRLGTEGYRNVMMQGLQQNMFQGRRPEELLKQMETAASMVKLLTGVMGSKDVQEAMQQIGQMKGMGINIFQNPQYATNLAHSTYKYSQMMGVPGAQLLQQAAQFGQQAYGQYGMPGFGGIIPAMQNMALAHELEKRKMLSTAEIAAAGGHSALAGKGVQATAAMMQHGGLGKMMLASGWMGGGNFSMNKFNNAVGEGYFPMMGQALGSIAGDTKAWASFMINQENLYASASAQGGLDANVKKALFAALDAMPGMDDENSAALMIKQILGSMGVDAPTALVKQMAMERSRPSTFKAMEKEANRHADRGFYFENAQKYHRGRGIGEAGEYLERIPSRLKNFFHTRPGQALHDMWSGFIGEPDNAPGMPRIGASEFSGNTVDNLRYMLGKTPSALSVKVNEQAYQDAYGLADREVGLGGNTGFWGSSRLFASRDALNMAPALEAMGAKQHKDYFDAILNPNSMSTSEAMSRMSKYIHFGSENGALANFRNATQYHGRMAGGVEWLADQLTSDNLKEITSSTTGSSWFKGMSSDQAAQMMRDAGIDISKYDKSKSNELMSRLLNSDNPALAEYAKQNGIDTRKLAYGLVSKYMGGDDNLSNLHKVMGGNDSFYRQFNVTGGVIAKNEGQTFGAEKYAMQASTGMSIGLDQINSSLKTLGLDYDDINSIMDSKGGAGKLENFAGLVDKLAQGEQLTGADWDSIDNPVLKQRLDKLAQMDPDELKGKISNDSFLGYGNKDSKTLDRKLSTLFETAAKGGAMDRVSRGVQDIWGFDLTNSDVSEAIRSGKFSELIEGAKGGSKEGKDLQSKLREIRDGDVNTLREQYGGLLGDRNVSDAELKDTIRNQLLGTSLETMKQEMDTKPKKGTIEAAIDKEKNALRVFMVDDKILKAEAKARENANATKPIDGMGRQPLRTATGGMVPSPATGSNSNASTFAWYDPRGWF